MAVGWEAEGSGNPHGFRWTAATGVVRLPPPSGQYAGGALAVSADGRFTVGVANVPGSSSFLPVRWDESGVGEALGLPVGEKGATPTSVSGDGAIVAGYTEARDRRNRAWIWTASTGTVDLRAYFVANGVDLTGWNLLSANVAPDGRTLYGRGGYTPTGGIARNESWIATIPSPAAGIVGVAGLFVWGQRKR